MDGKIISLEWTRSRNLGPTIETVCGYEFLPDDPNGDAVGGGVNVHVGGGGTYKGNCSTTSESDLCVKKVVDEIEYKQIINKLTNPCASSIFESLVNYIYKDNIKPEVKIIAEDIDLNFSASILNIFNNLKYNDYIIGNEDLDSYKNAMTTTSRGDVITMMSNSYLNNATQLSIARSMIHEQVHAYILYNNYSSENFQDAIKEYASNNGYKPNGNSTEKNRFHHEFMGQFVSAMAYSLYVWDKDYGTGGDLGWDYYKAMAFGGLFYNDDGVQVETDSFKALVPNISDRDKIKKIISNEETGNKSSKGTKCK